MAYTQGSIVLIPPLFKDAGNPRPMLILSNHTRPYQGATYTMMVITKRQREEAVEIVENDLDAGKLLIYPSYVSTWSLHEISHEDVIRRVGQVTDSKLREAVDSAYDYIRVI